MGYLLIPLSIVYLELFNAITSDLTGKVYSFAGVIFMSLAFGIVLDIIVSLFPKKAQKIAAFILTELITLFFLIEHFTDTAYSAFMSPASIASGAGGVAAGFSDIESGKRQGYLNRKGLSCKSSKILLREEKRSSRSRLTVLP